MTGEICNGNVCEEDTPDVCTLTTAIPNSDWLGKAVKCSACGSNQVQARADSCYYPYAKTTKCYNIPSSGSSASWSGRGTVHHDTATITCNGKRETWHLIGGNVSWWEAVEMCERLGLHMPPNRISLLSSNSSNGCNGSTRYGLLRTAFGAYYGYEYVWTEEDYGTSKCGAYTVGLSYGGEVNTSRNSPYGTSGNSRFALCGPVI